jgi:hypothetical protein
MIWKSAAVHLGMGTRTRPNEAEKGGWSIGSPSCAALGPCLTETAGGRLRINKKELDLLLTYPVAMQGVPVVFMFNGFQARAGWYTDLVQWVSSWGYVVAQVRGGVMWWPR